MTSFEMDLKILEKSITDPVRKVHLLENLIRGYVGAEHCRLDIFVPDQLVSLSVDEKLLTLELTHDSFAVWTASKQDVFHFIDNKVPVGQPGYEKDIPQEFRSLPPCASLFALAISSRLPTAVNGMWGTLILGHRSAGFFDRKRVETSCRILDAFTRNARVLMFLTDLVKTIYTLQRTHEAMPFANIVGRFLKDHAAIQSIGLAMLNTDKDRAVMFTDRTDRQLQGFKVGSQTLLSRTMADDTDTPREVIPSMIRTPEEQVPSDVGMLLPDNPMAASCILAIPLRKPKSASTGPPMMLSLSSFPDSSPRDRCLGMLYLEVHHRRRRALAPCITSLAPIFAIVLSQNVNITKDIERIVLIQPREHDPGLSPEKVEFLKKLRDITKNFQEARRRQWKKTESSLDGLQITSVICQRPSGAVLKGRSDGKDVAVKIMSITERNLGSARIDRELAISGSVDHKNIVKTRDHKIDISAEQILQCCPCTCPGMALCPRTASCLYHQIRDVLMSIVSSKLTAPVWGVLVTDFCDATLAKLIYHCRLFALPSNCPSSGCRIVDWKVQRNWNATVTLTAMLEIAEGVHYLHSMGIILGDLNPENVLIKIETSPSRDVRRTVKLGDFGSSCVEGIDRIQWNCTPAYSPPESFGLHQHPRVHREGCAGDAYSFAVMSWEMLMARKPFSEFVGNSMGLRQWVEGSGRCEFCRGFPEELRSLISRCWHQNPSERPTFKVIVAELKAMVGSI